MEAEIFLIKKGLQGGGMGGYLEKNPFASVFSLREKKEKKKLYANT